MCELIFPFPITETILILFYPASENVLKDKSKGLKTSAASDTNLFEWAPTKTASSNHHHGDNKTLAIVIPINYTSTSCLRVSDVVD